MTAKEAYHSLVKHLPFQPTKGQEGFLYKLSEFLAEDGHGKVFLLRGYAGTGKTSMVMSVTATLQAMRRKYALLAPTGRAAKVLASYSRQRAFTIHKFIYQMVTDEYGNVRFALRLNTGKRAVIIVDEASMIATQAAAGGRIQSRDLFSDLLQFLEAGEDCRLILIGDNAQLPPVGMAKSPALEASFLKQAGDFSKEMMHELRDVVRQEEGSGILENATMLRNLLLSDTTDFMLRTEFEDITCVDIAEMEEALEDAYATYGDESVMVVTRSNKRANEFNRQIRGRIKMMEEEMDAGDLLMVVRNNYHWLPKKSTAGFIANGDLMEVLRMGGIEERHGFRFADATVRLLDYPDDPPIEVKLMLTTLYVESPSLPAEDSERLYLSVVADYDHLQTPSEQAKAVGSDPYLNALQVKFGYAVTCHKAQGGQWPAVFVDQGYLTPEMMGTEYIRWLYTAITRASEQLYLVGFSPELLDRE
jgi:ATP-dependent exoDNAse (exonuclease V) alpha subunit